MPTLEIITRDDHPELHDRFGTIIQDWHEHLLESNARIAWLWQHGGMVSKGRVLLGACAKAAKVLKTLTNYDFAIRFNADVWGKLEHEQQTALIDHELSHALAVRDERGWKFSVKPHDLEEFRDVVERHGLYLEDVRLFAESINRGVKSKGRQVA